MVLSQCSKRLAGRGGHLRITQSFDCHRNYTQEIQDSDKPDALKANFKFLKNMHFWGKQYIRDETEGGAARRMLDLELDRLGLQCRVTTC